VFSYLTADDWHNIAKNYPQAVAHMQRLENLREMEHLKRLCHSNHTNVWDHARLLELELILKGGRNENPEY
jgi:hypothetical protein